MADTVRRIETLATKILPDGVVAAATMIDGRTDDLFPEERAAITHAVTHRQAEFAAGRRAARGALEQLGIPPCPIAVGEGRGPVWPSAITGSIAHCRTAAIAIAARLGAHGHVGIDLEEAEGLEDDLWPGICTSTEMEWLVWEAEPHRAAKTVFVIKEAVFKAQYPRTGLLLDFLDIETRIESGSGAFSAAGSLLAPLAISGRFAADEKFILACATAQDAPR